MLHFSTMAPGGIVSVSESGQKSQTQRVGQRPQQLLNQKFSAACTNFNLNL